MSSRRRFLAVFAAMGWVPTTVGAQRATALPPCRETMAGGIATTFSSAREHGSKVVFTLPLSNAVARSGMVAPPGQRAINPSVLIHLQRYAAATFPPSGPDAWRLDDIFVQFPQWRTMDQTVSNLRIELHGGRPNIVVSLPTNVTSILDGDARIWNAVGKGRAVVIRPMADDIAAKITRLMGSPFLVVLMNGNTEVARLGVDASPSDAAARAQAERLVGMSTARQCAPADCFLTTAAVQTVGLADDCWELRTLRRFRDKVLAQTAEGRALIDAYYALGPDLVRRVSLRPDAIHCWLRLWLTGVVPAAFAARLGLANLALRHYRAMVEQLEFLAITAQNTSIDKQRVVSTLPA